MKKQLLTLLLTLSLVTAILSTPAAALEGEAQRSADVLCTLGLIYSGGDAYDMTAPFTRAQAAVSLVALAGARQSAAAAAHTAPFTDMPVWAAGEISYAFQQGWLGSADTTFRPYAPITADEWFAMLLRMLGYSDADFSAPEAALFARHIGLATRSYTGALTLADLFESMRDALSFSPKGADTILIQQLVAQGVCPKAAATALGLLDERLTARQVADRYMAAMVQLTFYNEQEDMTVSPQEKAADANDPSAFASAFFITADGLAVTNHHSINKSARGVATLVSGESYPIERVIYQNRDADLAIIRISRTSLDGKTTSGFAALELTDTRDVRSGDVVFALSNPLGLHLAVSSGIVNHPAGYASNFGLPCIVNSANISPGSSGGALLNEYGRVIGVTAGAYALGTNMFLAVPVDSLLTADLTAEGQSLEDFYKTELALAKELGEKLEEAPKA